jgi:hypothetical protein
MQGQDSFVKREEERVATTPRDELHGEVRLALVGFEDHRHPAESLNRAMPFGPNRTKDRAAQTKASPRIT